MPGVANSSNVAGRIRSIYHRDAEVIHPPVDTSRFRADREREDFFLILSALVPYKKLEIAIEAFTALQIPLVVAGIGPERAYLERIAGPEIRFTGWVRDDEAADLLARARALVFPGTEDFGIVPLEAMASGCPVIAYRSGGALETVIGTDDEEGRAPTGLFFDWQETSALIDGLERFDAEAFDPAALRTWAERFDRTVFRERIRDLLFEEEARLD